MEANMIERVYNQKRAFVETLSTPLEMAFEYVLMAEYKLGSEITEGFEDGRFKSDNDEFVVITCKNLYKYFINVNANSLGAIMYQVSEFLCKK